jgi:EAL domain-containing protein (putative c-di-GMP-specific phosphodiesterase class I)
MNRRTKDRRTDRGKVGYVPSFSIRRGTARSNTIQDRRALVRALNKILATSGESRHGAVFLLSLEPGTFVGDSLGRSDRTYLVEAIEHRLLDLFGRGEVVAEVGDAEYAVMVRGLDEAASAERVAHRTMRILGQPIDQQAGASVPEVCLGVAIMSGSHGDAADIMRDAKAALRVAQSRQSGGCHVFDESQRNAIIERSSIHRNVVRALEHDEFVLHYQPIVSLDSLQLTAVEGLLRWNHPTDGITLPSEVIEATEGTQLINRIGTWAVRAGCRQAAEWWASGSNIGAPVVHINLSPHQLVGDPIVRTVAQALDEYGTPPESICLEITEDFVIEEAAIPILYQLKALGVSLSIDDFGTGHSSLERLNRLPIDSIKLDQVFVADIARSERHAAIAVAVAGIGKALGLSLIAEGVETSAQLERMRALGYENGQGFLFARPLPVDQLEADWTGPVGQHRSVASPFGLQAPLPLASGF